MAIALTIATSDSGGGAGVQADLKSFSALGVYGASVLCGVTAQNTRAVTGFEAVSPAMIRAQLDAVFDDLDIGAVKLGVLGGEQAIGVVADFLAGRDVPVVLDPVMIAKSGDALIPDDAVAAIRERLIPRATVLTPNLPEAARLLRRTGPGAAEAGTGAAAEAGPDGSAVAEAATEAEQAEQGRALRALGAGWVLMKGGHASGETCVDLLIGPQDHRLIAPRIATKNTHGTGCSLSSAIAAGLAQGMDVPAATARAHRWLQGAIAAADTLGVGHGHGPVHHFHEWWRA